MLQTRKTKSTMSATKVPIYMIEAFTSGNNDPYTGNPAAVCILQYDDDISDDIKQKIANTMNVTETVFVALEWTKNSETSQNTTNKNGTLKRTLRWFTPLVEVPLCGHGTAGATKAVLAHLSKTEPGTHVSKIEFHSKFKGVLPVKITASKSSKDLEENSNKNDSENDLMTLNFPIYQMKAIQQTSESHGQGQGHGYWLSAFIRNALGPLFPFEGDNISKVVKDVQLVDNGTAVIIQLQKVVDEPPETTIKNVQPNFEILLKPLGELGIGAPDDVIVTIKGEGADGEHLQCPHFYSRVFSPGCGVNEDPVCGSAHGALAPYWMSQLGVERDAVLRARQSSARGGDLWCQLLHENGNEGQGQGLENHDHGNARLLLSGRARVVYSGELNV